MDTIFLAFANQHERPLPTLQEEDDAVYGILTPRANKSHFKLFRDSFVTLEKLPGHLRDHRDDLVLFLFSGHAGRDRLLLGDGAAYGEGLAVLLGQCPNLKAVFLNGCSTQGQVAALLKAGVPVVIATSAPVTDQKATYFSKVFFESLQSQFKLGDAFEQAKGAVQLQYRKVSFKEKRDEESLEDAESEDATWGLFYKKGCEYVLDWRLPARSGSGDFGSNVELNQYLIGSIFEALAKLLAEDRLLSKAKQRIFIINNLPAPLGEPLRKLLVPTDLEGDEGYDKISVARLEQISEAYATCVELLGFTMLSQLWEVFYELKGLTIRDEQRLELEKFFYQDPKARLEYDFIELIRTVRAILDVHKTAYFVEELETISEVVNTDHEFGQAIAFLKALRSQVLQKNVDTSALEYLNLEAERALACLYSRLVFLAKYSLAATKSIDVLQFRHQRTPAYSHKLVTLRDLQGGMEEESFTLEKTMDNRSILLTNQSNKKNWAYLNLSPFVIDRNAFDKDKKPELQSIYFFLAYLKEADVYRFKSINKPNDNYWDISGKDETLSLIRDQFEAFTDQILLQNSIRNP